MSRKKKPYHYNYEMQDHRLSHVDSIEYLGIQIQAR